MQVHFPDSLRLQVPQKKDTTSMSPAGGEFNPPPPHDG